MSVNLFDLALDCLLEKNHKKKIDLSYLAHEKIHQDKNLIIESKELDFSQLVPGKPDNPVLILPKDLPRRSLANQDGQAALIHAICHIEFNAINLAWDIIVRFQDMPIEFYKDWSRVAKEEAKHFELLLVCLKQRGYEYGDFDAHNGLWDAAMQTSDDVLRRLAIVPRVHEAHGLDVTPNILAKVRSQTCMQDVAVALEIILEEEVGHVKTGTKWFNYVCAERKLEPLEEFATLIKEFNVKQRTKKMNISARQAAGFTQAELELLQ